METIETNIIIQTALLAVLPLLMQGLKKLKFVDNNKIWLCPLLCIAVSVATAYFMKLPQWLFVGILTGAACNKVYDWSKDLGALKLIIFFAASSMLFTSGCLYADSTTKIVLQQESMVISELNKRCQDSNDCEICKQGLQKASDYAKKVVTLSNGRE